MSERHSNANRLKAYIRATDRAKVLGFDSLPDCIRQKVALGVPISDLALKLDVSEGYLTRWMEHLGVQSIHKRKPRFWLPKELQKR